MSGRRWPAAWLVFVAIALAGCAGDPYPLPVGPPHAGQDSPAAVGEGIPAVVLFIQPRPGDSIEFLAAEPVGVNGGAAVEFFFSPPIVQADGSTLIGDRLLPLAGAIASAPNMPADASPDPGHTIGIVARMTASRAGRYLLSNVRLRYRLNAGPEQTRAGIDVLFTICADDPRPTDCAETAPP